MSKTPTDLLYGTLDILVLKTLSWQPMHGYAISDWLEKRTKGTIEIDDAALYKALHRLEEREDVSGEWGLSENNRRARYYRLTPAGRRRLRAETRAWNAFSLAVSSVLQTA